MNSRPAYLYNARRRRNAEWLIDYLARHSGKVYISPDNRAEVEAEIGLDKYAVEQAIDDLREAGNIDARIRGDYEVIELLSGHLDRTASASTPTPTTITIAKTKNGGWRR